MRSSIKGYHEPDTNSLSEEGFLKLRSKVDYGEKNPQNIKKKRKYTCRKQRQI